MEKALFYITCTTCQARLAVHSEEAIGAILACPKCDSMVQITPPEDWSGDPETTPHTAETGETPAAMAEVTAAEDEPRQTSRKPAAVAAAGAAGREISASEAAEVSSAEAAADFVPTGRWLSSTELIWRKWLMLGTASVAGVVVLAGICSVFFFSDRPQPPAGPEAQKPAESVPAELPATVEDEGEPLPARLDQRWLPDRTTMLLSLRLSRLAEEPQCGRLIDQAAEGWRPTIGAVLKGLTLRMEGIRRLSWASTDLADWPRKSVVVIELEEDQDAGALAVLGEAADVSLAGVACRRVAGSPWPYPFAIVDRQTIVTGDRQLLGHLARRSEAHSEAHLESETIARLLKATAADEDFMLLLDLTAARNADWKLPAAVLDIWPSGRQPWHIMWEMPVGLGCTARWSQRLHTEAALVCDGETAAGEVHTALGQLVAAASGSLTAQVESLGDRLRAGEITAAAAHQYELLLKHGLVALKSARWEVVDETVWVRVDWGQGPSPLADAAIESRRTIRTDWLSAARVADTANHRRLLTGLGGYQKAEGEFPAGAAGGALLPPETRLSWIATMLPYYGHADWHRRLEFGYPWNGPQNRAVTRQLLPEVVNPALGPQRTEAGFPVTHYVGVAGVGSDAGRLKANHPRAGVFGFGRRTRPEDISDGAANTIAVLGVAQKAAAWAAGGDPTVRALTARPYVNGPDGFGSGQPEGMLAGMADGSVRFISKDIDPGVLEKLATIAGGEETTVAALRPEAVRRSEEPSPPIADPEDPPPQPPEPAPEEEPPTDVPAPVVTEKPAVPKVDVEARLADVVPQIELDEVPLGEAVDLLAAMSTLPVSFDPEALLQLGVTLRDPVTLKSSASTVGSVLETIAAERGLVYVVENGQVLITSPSAHRETLRRVRYAVDDLAGDQTAMAQLATLVQKVVAPPSWRQSGGRGTVEVHGGALLVMQIGAVHHQILTFCEKLRNARGRSLRSRYDPRRFTLTTRLDQARETLGRKLSVNFQQPAGLGEILGYVEQLSRTDILLDRTAMAAVGLWDGTEATLTVRDRPLAEALRELLRPLGLAYRVIDGGTLHVTTSKAAAAGLELEFYPLGKLLTEGQTAEVVVERLKSRVAGSTWSDAGGPGVAHFDQPSDYLIVLQSQPVQAELQQLLAEE